MTGLTRSGNLGRQLLVGNVDDGWGVDLQLLNYGVYSNVEWREFYLEMLEHVPKLERKPVVRNAGSRHANPQQRQQYDKDNWQRRPTNLGKLWIFTEKLLEMNFLFTVFQTTCSAVVVVNTARLSVVSCGFHKQFPRQFLTKSTTRQQENL